MARILVIDDNESIRDGVAAVVTRAGHEAHTAASGEAGLKAFATELFDVVVTDLKMDEIDGLEVLRQVKERRPETVVLMMTAYGTVENAVEAMKIGAFDYVQKPFSPSDLRIRLERALEWSDLHLDREKLHQALRQQSKVGPEEEGFCGMVGESPAMRQLFEKIRKVAASDTPVHIHGESGTGKELVASAIHRLSSRSEGPWVTVNCGAIPETLFESELFGHEKGAFTGAAKRKLGRFELAAGGTLFLDEVGELPLSMQVKLLRVLQEGTVDRVGSERPISVDARIISATNKKLEDEVEAGRFREDLYYRLHVVPLQLPPLRERTEDIVSMARHFMEKLRARTGSHIRALTPAAEAALRSYHFPGNVRELENIMEQAMVFAEPPAIDVPDLPSQVSTVDAQGVRSIPIPSTEIGLTEFLESAERQMIMAAYEASGGVKTETARRLKIKTSALYYKLEKYGIGTVAGRPAGSSPQEG